MLSRSCPPFVCRRCLARASGSPQVLAVGQSDSSPRVGSGAHRSRLFLHNALRKWATTQSLSPAIASLGRTNIPNAQPEETSPDDSAERLQNLPIRERLQQWDLLNGQGDIRDLPLDVSVYGTISNTINRTQATGSSVMDRLRPSNGEDAHGSGGDPASEDDGGAAVGLDSRDPGDLVELRQFGSRVPLFGVYLGFFSGCNHFYASNGRWITSTGFSFVFTVSNFASLSDLEPILAKIPKDVSLEDLEDMRRNFGGPSREEGIALIKKMADFKVRADTIFDANLGRLEEAGARLALPKNPRYLSLSEIADALLPSSLKRAGRFSSPALYAVHTAMNRQDIGFRLMNASSDCHRPDNLVEVFPQDYTVIINNVAAMVREYTEAMTKYSRPLTLKDLEKITRKMRQWTSHGILKASRGVELPKTKWSPPSMDVLSYLEWWASYDLFDLGSRFHSSGALILRALDLYDGVVLDQSTAWTFLQEIGRIAPWEIPSRYKPRLPGVAVARGGGLSRETPDHLEASKRPDIAADARDKIVGGETIFCIDAPSTTVIDDGISLERTGEPDEFWVHIHAADPASIIRPNSELCKFMELVPENIYLPGHFQAMIPSELGEEDAGDYKSEGLVKEFSLRSGGPTLTFSAKVNSAGDVLDYKVEPGTLGDVFYLDPEDVSNFCNEPPPPVAVRGGHSLVAGMPPKQAPPAPERPMIAAEDLAENGKNDLLTLYRLAEAVRRKRLSKGAWPYFFPRPSVSVIFDAAPETASSSESATVVPADPYIEVKRETSTACSVVSNFMVLAGEIAARWCASRGIPIPYRKDIKSAQNREAAFDYAWNEIYPLIQQGIEPSERQRQELVNLTGGIEISARPGPYFLLGLDMYAKATSPLRRFSDLLVHWQIHAALAFERSAKRSIDPAMDKVNAIVPFKTAELSDSLRMLQMREKKARRMSRGIVDWILIALVRAWRFEGRAPPALRFTVSMRMQTTLHGRLDLFDLDAILDASGLDGCRLIKDTRLGDQFEVELVDVNVHSREILLRATRYLGQQQQEEGQPASRPAELQAPHAVRHSDGSVAVAGGGRAPDVSTMEPGLA
ncbi:RNB domain-containing protein [Hirsutella rhossiliensis]|uniref:RNB domain-containing protein n=1 Tax=Hirsutella rhossiliensis TaxID=111463 RepID=A0A9P8SCB0_9HYPO|nr:RNB domain-containing protein [Hirsutella rhossiliensis]KAH0957361.1 RNB domain-containing protein [Hirsutella rhossiliensis]